MNERFAKRAAKFLKYACYLVICFCAIATVLSFMGRQTFSLHTKVGTFERATYAGENHISHSHGMTVQMGDDIHVWTNDSDQIDLSIHIGLSLMFAVQVIPMMFAFWLLSRVFSNIQNGQIFTEHNASCLLYYGLLQLSVAVLAPFIKLLICWLASQASGGRMSIATGQAMLNALVPSIAFIVAAYIVHYGVHLQDEVDHTL